MICRLWHAWTTPESAGAYEELLTTEIFPFIAARNLAGYRGVDVLRREAGAEVEFLLALWFDSLDGVREFAGEDYEAVVVRPRARALLARFDERAQHYEVPVKAAPRD